MAGEGAEPSLRDPLPRDKWGQGLTVQLGPTWGQACAPSHDCVTPGERGHLCGGFIPSVGAVSTHMRGQPQGRPPHPANIPVPSQLPGRSDPSAAPPLRSHAPVHGLTNPSLLSPLPPLHLECSSLHAKSCYLLQEALSGAGMTFVAPGGVERGASQELLSLPSLATGPSFPPSLL